MSRPSRYSNLTAKALVSPMFAWTNAVLSGGDMMLDAMRTAVRNSRGIRVAVLPEATKVPAKASKRRAKGKRRR
jgi:hypothetical protein